MHKFVQIRDGRHSVEIGKIKRQWVAVLVHFGFIIIGARMFRLDVSMAAVSSVAAVGGAASAPVAAGYHREELVPVSIMLALIGYALGNYLGVATAYLCHLLV